MSQQLTPYALETSHPAVHNPLLEAPPETVPAVDELEATLAELGLMKARSLERGRKAAGDLKIIETEMRRMKEREKGKAKASGGTSGMGGAMDKGRVKREQSYTPFVDKERSFSPTLPSASVGGASTAPSLNASPTIPSKVPPDIRKLKKKEKDKKRKRDDDSDSELDSQRSRKASPHPPPPLKDHTHRPSKLGGINHTKFIAPDWSLPSSSSLLPSHPISVPSLPAGPRKPIEVKEDFSKAKAPPSQVPITTFYASVEPWVRNIREEDVGWLEFDGDTVGPYVVPELGKHYTEQWEDEDIAFYGGVPAALDFSSSNKGAAAASASNHAFTVQNPLPKWDAATMGDGDLATERGMGPVSERLAAALLPAVNQATWKAAKEAEEAYESKMNDAGPSGSQVNGVVQPPREKLLVAEFEERLRDTMRFHGLLQAEPRFGELVDDPISTTLRQAQRQLRLVAAENKARRARLASIARDRLAYQEYVDTRDVLDKNVTTMYSKLQKKDGPKANKKKKKGDSRNEREREMSAGVNGVNGSVNGVGINGNGPAVIPLPNPASLGLGPDEDNTLVVPEMLKNLIETRRQWVDVIGESFEELELEALGRVRGVPQKSVYEGVDEEVKALLASSGVFVPPKSEALGISTNSNGNGEKG